MRVSAIVTKCALAPSHGEGRASDITNVVRRPHDRVAYRQLPIIFQTFLLSGGILFCECPNDSSV